MSNLADGDGRHHIDSKLMRESLQNRGVMQGTDGVKDRRILPDITLVSIGGQSIFDKGKSAICLLYTSPSPRDATLSRMPSSA